MQLHLLQNWKKHSLRNSFKRYTQLLNAILKQIEIATTEDFASRV